MNDMRCFCFTVTNERNILKIQFDLLFVFFPHHIIEIEFLSDWYDDFLIVWWEKKIAGKLLSSSSYLTGMPVNFDISNKINSPVTLQIEMTGLFLLSLSLSALHRIKIVTRKWGDGSFCLRITRKLISSLPWRLLRRKRGEKNFVSEAQTIWGRVLVRNWILIKCKEEKKIRTNWKRW